MYIDTIYKNVINVVFGKFYISYLQSNAVSASSSRAKKRSWALLLKATKRQW